MITILIPMGGKTPMFDTLEYPYPKALIEIKGKTIIQRVIENYAEIPAKKFVFIVDKAVNDQFHLDQIFSLLTDQQCDVVKLSGETKGALCSTLMAIEHINPKKPLIIANGDQIINSDIRDVINYFNKEDVDAGVITFESIHPKWSFVRVNENEDVVEAAEKRPLSKNAIAGFYYFKNGSDFIASAMNSIKKDANVGGQYYIAPSLNEMILDNKLVKKINIESSAYHPLYSPQKIKEYEEILNA